MLGVYDNFPATIHRIDTFNSVVSSKKLQTKLIQIFREINSKTFSFEDIANPTISNAKICFEVGFAEGNSFCFIDQEEVKRVTEVIQKERFQALDFFCAIRYQKMDPEKKGNLKCDYYLLRMMFGKNLFEVQIHHQRGPRYITPEDLSNFIFDILNNSPSKILTKLEMSK